MATDCATLACEDVLPETSDDPIIIQGGMGVAVSSWRLARAVSSQGHLGVVSGTALDVVMARRLQHGDPGGHIRRAAEHFPAPDVVDDVLRKYFAASSTPRAVDLAGVPMYTAASARARHALAIMAGFVEVFLAKEGHRGSVGINFLEKIQLPTPATLYGALLAGVDYVLVGAGIPRDIPALLDGLTCHQRVALPLHVTDAGTDDRFELVLEPASVLRASHLPQLRRPRFLAIASSATLAASLVRHGGRVDGFVVEGPTAGGHNAPPRGRAISEQGEPVYGPRDNVDLARMRDLGLPFWLAGSYGTPERVAEARQHGAAGVQVGTLFAFCEESGLDPALRASGIRQARHGAARVFTDPLASPTDFPLKVLQLEGTLSEPEIYEARTRRCDLGYLRELYRRADGSIGYRCPAEPVDEFVRKGGRLEDTRGRKCLCNGLLATVGLGQRHAGGAEPAIVTSGSSLEPVTALLAGGRETYSAADAIAYLTGPGSGIRQPREDRAPHAWAPVSRDRQTASSSPSP